MSDAYDSYPPVTPEYGGDTGDQTSGKVDSAKEQASQVKDSATDAGKQVAGTAKDEARNVASEAKSQISGLVGQTRDQLSDQAGEQQKRVASGIRSVGDELKGMADKSENSGMATEIVHQVASRADGVASWLDDRDPGSLLDEVKRFARERPGTFIAIAAVTGLVAGRLTRSLVSEAKESHEAADSGTATSRSSTGGTAAPATNPADTVTTPSTEYAAPDFDSVRDGVGMGSAAPVDPSFSSGDATYSSDTQR